MTDSPKLKPCPFCKRSVISTYCQDSQCAGTQVWDGYLDIPVRAELWNLRAPSFTAEERVAMQAGKQVLKIINTARAD